RRFHHPAVYHAIESSEPRGVPSGLPSAGGRKHRGPLPPGAAEWRNGGGAHRRICTTARLHVIPRRDSNDRRRNAGREVGLAGSQSGPLALARPLPRAAWRPLRLLLHSEASQGPRKRWGLALLEDSENLAHHLVSAIELRPFVKAGSRVR